jgi:hypothetical protein
VLCEYRALCTGIAQFTEQQAALLRLTPTVGELFELIATSPRPHKT